MTLTNHSNLPEPIVRAVANDDYSKGDSDYSVSELVNPPQITLLRQRHRDKVVEDVADRMWSFLGKMGHLVAERAGADNALQEERLFAEVHGKRISGQIDLGMWDKNGGELTDYKFTSVYKRMFSGGEFPEWEAAQNIYAWLLERNFYSVQRLRLCLIYRDWRLSEARQGGGEYPPRAEIFNLPAWSDAKRTEFIEERVDVLRAYEHHPDDQLPLCLDEEMWAKPDTWAVMKEGGKRAVRVFDTPHEAAALAEGKGDAFKVVHRLGKRTRCEDYCEVAPFCHQFKAYQAIR